MRRSKAEAEASRVRTFSDEIDHFALGEAIRAA
jgi:hypothetical protein